MSELTQPSEIARETLRRLALRRIPPTPENYRQLYQEISGSALSEPFPERSMKAVGSLLPRTTPEQVRFAREFESAVTAKDWAAFKCALVTMLGERAGVSISWAPLIRELVSQLDSRHSGITTAAKRKALDQVIESSDNERLYGRLQGLLRSWSRAPLAEGSSSVVADIAPIDAATPAAADSAARDDPSPDASDQLRELVAELLEQDLAALLGGHAELSRDVAELAAEIRACHDDAALAAASDKLKQFGHRFRWLAEDQSELRSGLLRLLQLLVDNIGELVSDDQWLRGQIDMLRELFPTPLDARRLDDVERRLKEVIHKQSLLKKDLDDAKDRIKTMLASFVDHLASFTETTGEYHSTIERCAEKISSADDISELGEAIDEVMRETRNVQQSVERSRQNMQEMKSRVEDADRKISLLQEELAHTSQMVRHDQLTGALNRKGMEEAFHREASRATRRSSPLCLALLDIDNFKKINDNHGHHVGDEALVYLARLARQNLRPQDMLARYGGEEFVIMLPDTGVHDSVIALTRLQRELTKTFFLHDNDKLLITFSAGVTEVLGNEPMEQAIKRADGGMYQAKRAGKNRVVAVEPPADKLAASA
jgi:diguanylate cyclase